MSELEPGDGIDAEKPTSVSEVGTSDLLCAGLPVVGGRTIDCSLNDMERRARIFLRNEQENITPDTAMIAFLCDVVRLSREYGDNMMAKVKALGESLDT